MGFSGTVSIWAMKDNDYQATNYPGTGAGLQSAIDSLQGGKGIVQIGPGTLSITTAVSIHGGCHLRGSGMGATVIQRATGSLASGDSAYTGVSVLLTPYGSNGTPASAVANAQADATVSDLTLDGNQANFGAVNPATPRHMGAYWFWADRPTFVNVEFKEFLQNGAYLDACRSGLILGCRFKNCGQYASASTRNSLDISNTQASAVSDGYATGFLISGITSESPTDAHIDIANCSQVTVRGAYCSGGGVVLELQGDVGRVSAMGDFSFSGIIAKDFTEQFFTNNIDAAIPLTGVTIDGCLGECHTSSHATAAINISQASVAQQVTDFVLANTIIRNINSSDTNGIDFISIRGSSASASERIKIVGCSFLGGAAASVRTGNHGLNLASNVAGLAVKDSAFSTVPGVGMFIHPGTDQTVRDVDLSHLTVDTTNNDGYQIVENSSTNGAIQSVTIIGCITRNACRQTGSNGFRIGALSAAGGGSVSNMTVEGCRVYKSSGANPAIGLDINQGAGGTTTKIYAGANDFDLTTPYKSNAGAGTPTAVHIRFPAGKGTNITSAATIAIPTDGDVFHVTGSTNVTNGITVLAHDNGRTVKLIFDSTPTVSDTGTSKLQGDFVATADDVLTLTCDGTNWYEAARSPN